jgi:hypothetical protein
VHSKEELPLMKSKQYLIYCKAHCKYKGSPKPPSPKIALQFEPGDIIQINDFSDSKWWSGIKYVFNGSPLANDLFREEGYFLKSHIKLINPNEDLSIYSWYLSKCCDREMAEMILNRIRVHTKCTQTVFMVWPSNEMNYSITVSDADESSVIHYEVSEKYFSVKNLVEDSSLKNGGFFEENNFGSLLKQESCLVETKFFSIEKRHFRNMINLVDFYKNTFGLSYREALPRPIYIALACDNFQANDEDEICLRKGEKYFVISENSSVNKCLVFDKKGLVGFVAKKLLRPY